MNVLDIPWEKCSCQTRAGGSCGVMIYTKTPTADNLSGFTLQKYPPGPPKESCETYSAMQFVDEVTEPPRKVKFNNLLELQLWLYEAEGMK